MSQDDLYGAPAGWYPDPLGLPQLRWWNNHAWTEQTSAARQPMVVQDTKFAWADDELPTRRDERLRERNDRAANPPAAPTAEALRELEPPRAFSQMGPNAASAGMPSATPVVPPMQAFTPAPAEAFTAPVEEVFVAPEPEAIFIPKPDVFSSPQADFFTSADNDLFNAPPPAAPAETPQAEPALMETATFETAPLESAPAESTVRVDSLYTPDPVIEVPVFEAPVASPATSLATIFDARPMEAPQEALNALFGEPALRRAGTRVKTPVVTIEHIASTATPDRSKASATSPSWLIAMVPLFQIVVSILMLNILGQQGSQFVYWAILVLPYFVTIGLAYSDYNLLVKAGHRNPASWRWAFASAPVYLLMRARAVIAETGHGIGPVLAWFGLGVLHLASFLAVPGVIIALLPSLFTTQIEQSVVLRANAIMATDMTVTCAGNPPVLPGETIKCVSVSGSREQDVIVTFVRTNGWIGWEVLDWGDFKS